MIIVTPLTLKGTRSMMVMQQLQPEMKKIQTQYKDDRQKLNEELLKFYKENDINPLGGCLPLLVQMPVFIVLYQVLRGLTRRASGMGFDFGWVGGQLGSGHRRRPSRRRSTGVFDPAYLNHSSKMYQTCRSTNTMQAFGMDLAESASKALQPGRRPRPPLPRPDRHRGGHRLRPAAADPGPQPATSRSTRSSR